MNFTSYGVNQAMIDSTLKKITLGNVFEDLMVTNFGFSFGNIETARNYSKTKNKKLYLISKSKLQVPEEEILRREYLEISLSEVNHNTPFEIKEFNPFKSNWQHVVEDIWGNPDNFKKFGKGVGAFDGEKQVAEAMVGFPGTAHWEIGTITHEDYRGRGLSQVVCHTLVTQLLKNNISPSWSCNEDNLGSWKVAERIGFRNPTHYFAYVINPWP